jgi:hypothetical protein
MERGDVTQSRFLLTRQSLFRTPTQSEFQVNILAASAVNLYDGVSAKVVDRRWVTERDAKLPSASPAIAYDDCQE